MLRQRLTDEKAFSVAEKERKNIKRGKETDGRSRNANVCQAK